MAAAILFLQDEHSINRRVFKLGWRTLIFNAILKLTREMIGETHNLMQADIAAHGPEQSHAYYDKGILCLNYVLIKTLFRKYVDKNLHLLWNGG